MQLHQQLTQCNYSCRSALEIIARWIKPLAIENTVLQNSKRFLPSVIHPLPAEINRNNINGCLDSCRIAETSSWGIASGCTCSRVNCQCWVARDDLGWKHFLCFCCWQHFAVSFGKYVSLASVWGMLGLAAATETSVLLWKPINFLIHVSIKFSPG